MKIFLDFDDTLFDTNAFFVSLQDIFEEFGISKEISLKSYQEIKAEFPSGGWCYSFERHIEKLKQYVSFDEKGLRNRLMIYITTTERFLFSDVRDFLSSLKKNGHTLFILSFGDIQFQSAKIAGAGISQFIERNIITDEDKVVALQGEINDNEEEIWFFDDRIHFLESVKRAFPGIKTVFVKRKEGRYQDEPTGFCDYVVRNLIEGERIVYSSYSKI